MITEETKLRLMNVFRGTEEELMEAIRNRLNGWKGEGVEKDFDSEEEMIEGVVSELGAEWWFLKNK